ncbi:PREDICTED: RNA-directed DNA polymerase from mobile element jockey-like [Wasmannia auropunctata]|uniref:RNA-directed DNA polymerase from mobile element jockey-like n=1 Tax=Wasmannia auropunctata TaxID=64793 RepID=UPI0005EF0586|nr:PREDICTED: RNA-directed DNA polymerase from mobile element jockey-like [Wasmannia auropunctata]
MILPRLQWLIENLVLLPEFQFGFRAFRSCLDNLTIFTADVQTGFLQGKATAALFLDIKSAFDNVLPDILLTELASINLPPNILRFIENLISVREVQFVVQGRLTSSRISRKGTPQGSVLSPTLFNLYLRKILSSLHPDTKIIQFADDIVIYSTASHVERAIQSLQRSLDGISSFLRKLGLEISPQKTQFMIFSRSRKLSCPNNNFFVTCDGTRISPTSSAKFLGVIFDPTLKGSLHLEHVNNKARKISQVISALRGVWWGSSPQLLLGIYRSLCRSVMEYASHIFALENSRGRQRLEITQNSVIRTCLGMRVSTPLNVLFAEAREPPLKLRFQYLASKYICKVLSIEDHPVVERLENLLILTDSPAKRLYLAHNFYLIQIFRQIFLYKQTLHKTVILPVFSYTYSSIFVTPEVIYPKEDLVALLEGTPKEHAQAIFIRVFQDEIGQSVVFYTDGSKIEEISTVGAACYSPQLNLELMDRLPQHASVFSAEAWAIYNVILSLKAFSVNDAVIVTDSLSTLQALQSTGNHDASVKSLSKKDQARFSDVESDYQARNPSDDSSGSLLGSDDYHSRSPTPEGNCEPIAKEVASEMRPPILSSNSGPSSQTSHTVTDQAEMATEEQQVAKANEDIPSSAQSVDTVKSSEEALIENLEVELLEAIGNRVAAERVLAPAIPRSVAVRLEDILKKGLPKEERERAVKD